MNINSKIFAGSIDFIKRRFAELAGLAMVVISGGFIFSLSKYSPDSPSFILKSEQIDFTDYFGSLANAISDIFLQSFGLISFLIGVSILLWGIKLILDKKINKFLNKLFYTVLYISTGCLLVYIFNNNSFWLIHHGNAGFVGEKSFNLIYKYFPIIESDFSKIALIILFLLFFSLSSGINFTKFFVNFSSLFRKKRDGKKVEEVDNNIDLNINNESQTNINQQQSFSFQKIIEKNSKKYALPSLTLLSKKTTTINNNNTKLPSADFIEKILLDFGIEGKIKKVNNGPVVSLYEFEPAPE